MFQSAFVSLAYLILQQDVAQNMPPLIKGEIFLMEISWSAIEL